MVLLQFSWRRGAKDSRGQGFKGLFSKDFISAVRTFPTFCVSFLMSITFFLFSIHLIPRTLESSIITPIQLELTHLFYPN